jgi:hypothetical protein
MKAKRLFVATLLAGGVSLVAGVPAAANIVWCLADPPMQVDTASGTNLTVNTTIYFDKASANLKNDVQETATTVPDGSGGTLITVQVLVPNGVQAARVVASLNKYKISASGNGTGGQMVTLYLDAPVS